MNASNTITEAQKAVATVSEEKVKGSKSSLKEELAAVIEVIVSRVSNKEIKKLEEAVARFKAMGLNTSEGEAKIASLKATAGSFTDEEKIHLFDTEILPVIVRLYGGK